MAPPTRARSAGLYVQAARVQDGPRDDLDHARVVVILALHTQPELFDQLLAHPGASRCIGAVQKTHVCHERVLLNAASSIGRGAGDFSVALSEDLTSFDHMATILYVDDEPAIGLILQDTLERLGHTAIGATSVADALGALERGDVDLIISDFKMPGLSGLEFLELLRE